MIDADPIRVLRLQSEYNNMLALKDDSALIDFTAEGDPPDVYIITYYCKGLATATKVAEEHRVRIYLHAQYPESPPEVSFLTPIFHPNMIAPFQMPEVQARLAQLSALQHVDSAAHDELDHLQSNPELYEARVCLDVLDENWAPQITLDEICQELGEMIQYRRYNVRDPLNLEANCWAMQNKARLPLDSRSLREIKLLRSIHILGNDALDGGDEIEIHFGL
jgi:ubiquitin-protein ligase